RGGVLEKLLGVSELQVNSLHSQGIDRLGNGLNIEAVADDGLVEAYSVDDAAAFALAVQWHPEWRVMENPFSKKLFEAFGDACRSRARGSSSHDLDHAVV
ncbi:MAG TPA: gamma-glutamyl-gamma-aminobutyrate hydrolase family protein, partial [Gammaproteobacteria bacterium]|nr:gamma-glutamyl-gamma-aminobutyrate hydrolase family protein [Gammaproteobacteria bacterium]